jgi:hypothetical protein
MVYIYFKKQKILPKNKSFLHTFRNNLIKFISKMGKMWKIKFGKYVNINYMRIKCVHSFEKKYKIYKYV